MTDTNEQAAPNAISQAQATLGDYPRAQRMKTFDELTDSEKIQALRNEVRALRELVGRLHPRLHALEMHEHGRLGHVVIPIHVRSDGDTCGRYDPLA